MNQYIYDIVKILSNDNIIQFPEDILKLIEINYNEYKKEDEFELSDDETKINASFYKIVNDNTVLTFASGTQSIYESGSSVVFDEGSTVTFSGTTNYDGDTNFNGDITVATGTLTTFLGDVFFDGIEITMSGTLI